MTIERKLLVRSHKHQFERIDDYLVRLAGVNGFSSTNKLIQYFRSWIKTKELNCRGIDKADTTAQILTLYLGRKIEAKSFDRLAFTSVYQNLKICKACFSKNKAIPFYWYLDDYCWCHTHHEPLHHTASKQKETEKYDYTASHPIVEFLDCDDPWSAYSSMLRSEQELRWLCYRLKQFSEAHLATHTHIADAISWIDSAHSREYLASDRFERVINLMVERSMLSASDIRLLAALLLWQRMVPNNLFRAAGAGAEGATEASLEWASRELIASEPMLMFICDAHQAPRNTPKLCLRDYIPLLADLDESTDKALRQAVYSCGLTTELLVMLPSRPGEHSCKEKSWDSVAVT